MKKTVLEVIDDSVFRFTYSYNSANQLTSYFDPIMSQSYNLAYDKQGNLSFREDNLGTTSYCWNAKNRLTKLTLPSGNFYTYSYSPSGTRLTKGSSKGTFTRYSYEGIKLQSEVITTNPQPPTPSPSVITTSYSYTPGGEPYSMKRSGVGGQGSATYYYHTNAHGDVISLTDQTAHEVASYSYGPWGNCEKAKGPLADSNPIRYAGYYYDSETGMYYLINRYYDSSLGRFISRDPVKQADNDGLGKNPYLYCNNDPQNASDPSGTKLRQSGWRALYNDVWIDTEFGPDLVTEYLLYKFLAIMPNRKNDKQRGEVWVKYNASHLTPYGYAADYFFHTYYQYAIHDSKKWQYMSVKKLGSYTIIGSAYPNPTLTATETPHWSYDITKNVGARFKLYRIVYRVRSKASGLTNASDNYFFRSSYVPPPK